VSGRYILGVVVAVAVLGLILMLVGKRRMREEYSVLWIVAGTAMVVFALLGRHTDRFFNTLGIESVLNALLFFGLIFLLIVNIYASVKISALTNRLKELVQYIALLEASRPGANGKEAHPDGVATVASQRRR
jgi:hypothetical protein